MTLVNDERDSAAGPVLVMWSRDGRGAAAFGRRLAGQLGEALRPWSVHPFDMIERAGALALASAVAGAVGGEQSEAALLARLLGDAAARDVGTAAPRALVVLDATAAAVAVRWQSRAELRAPVVGIVESLALDPRWLRCGVDRILVLDDAQRGAVVGAGVAPEAAYAIGPCVSQAFEAAAAMERAELRARFSIAAQRPVVLVAASGLSDDVLTSLLFQLSLSGDRHTLLFDVDADERAADLLRRRADLYEVAAQLFGRSAQSAELWACADVVVGELVPALERRALRRGMVIVALPAADAEQRAAAEQWQRRGIGRGVAHISALSAELDMALEPARLQRARGQLEQVPGGAIGRLSELLRDFSAQRSSIIAGRVARDRPEAVEQARRDVEAGEGGDVPGRAGEASAAVLEPIGKARSAASSTAATPDPALEDLAGALADADRQVSEEQQQVVRWERRLELAERRGDAQLVAEAKRQADRHRAAMHAALAELARLDGLRQNQSGRSAQQVEESFRQLEVERALAQLKRRVDQERSDDEP